MYKIIIKMFEKIDWPYGPEPGNGHKWTPELILSDDIFVVSYPKSGNTWIRFLIANALYPGYEVDFHTIHELIPEIGGEDQRKNDLPNPRLFKSHAPYQPEYPRVIYVLRDGRDVYASYYHYRQPDLSGATTFEDFLQDNRWPTRWGEHVRGWMDAALDRDDILIVRFEDLKKDSAHELRRMLSFLDNKTIPDSRIQQAVEASSFENMRRLEEERGRKYGSVDQFMRKGESGGWQELFTDEAKDIFKKKDGQELVRLGYERDFDW